MIKVKYTQVDLSKELRKVVKKMPEIADRALKGTTDEILANLQKTTETWEDKPVFVVKKIRQGREITTNDEIWHWLNEGTEAHSIYPRSRRGPRKRARSLSFLWAGPDTYRGKTAPGSFSSGYAYHEGRVDQVFFTGVQHPGIEPRKWTEILQKEYENDPAERMEAELRFGLDAAGL